MNEPFDIIQLAAFAVIWIGLAFTYGERVEYCEMIKKSIQKTLSPLQFLFRTFNFLKYLYKEKGELNGKRKN